MNCFQWGWWANRCRNRRQSSRYNRKISPRSPEPKVSVKTFFVISGAWSKFYGLFTLPDTCSVTDSDSKSYSYIVLYRKCSRCMDSDPDSRLESFLGRISVPGLGSESMSINVNKPLHRFIDNCLLETNSACAVVFAHKKITLINCWSCL